MHYLPPRKAHDMALCRDNLIRGLRPKASEMTRRGRFAFAFPQHVANRRRRSRHPAGYPLALQAKCDTCSTEGLGAGWHRETDSRHYQQQHKMHIAFPSHSAFRRQGVGSTAVIWDPCHARKQAKSCRMQARPTVDAKLCYLSEATVQRHAMAGVASAVDCRGPKKTPTISINLRNQRLPANGVPCFCIVVFGIKELAFGPTPIQYQRQSGGNGCVYQFLAARPFSTFWNKTRLTTDQTKSNAGREKDPEHWQNGKTKVRPRERAASGMDEDYLLWVVGSAG